MEKVTGSVKQFLSHISSSSSSSFLTSDFDLIVFSHLRWNFVFQRPQHIMKRLADKKKILFVEEPIEFTESERGTARMIRVNEHITVLQPRIYTDNLVSELTPLVFQYIDKLQLRNPVLWFYSAAFEEIIDQVPHVGVVYDCMDELSAFKGAPASLITQEQKLLSRAEIVFTGGKSLYEAKKKYQEHVYCFPSSVDRHHFEKALKKSTPIPLDLERIPGPKVGFYGVIDERFNTKLLATVAQLLPKVSFVMIGPVVKISDSELPKLPNIYYLGNKDYQDLPAYLKGIDVAIMPFALNEATRFISPTKTLEFMAALKPIVSTPIIDVKRYYRQEVKIAETPRQFSRAIQEYMLETKVQRRHRIALQKAVLDRTSWDQTVKSMQQLMQRHIMAVRSSEVTASKPLSLAVNLSI